MFAIRKKEDNWVNLIKLLCIFIVVLGHYNYTDWNGTVWLLYIVKSAVSVMFIYSGYYAKIRCWMITTKQKNIWNVLL